MIRRLLAAIVNKPRVLKLKRVNDITLYLTDEFTSVEEIESKGTLIVRSYGDIHTFRGEDVKKVKKFLNL